jgi:hypothetical protein
MSEPGHRLPVHMILLIVCIESLNLPLIIIIGIVGRESGITCTQEINKSATEATAAVGIVGDGPTVVAEDDVVVLLEECKPGSTLVEHPQNYLQKVLTWPSSSSCPPHPSRLKRHPVGQ